MYVTKPFNSLTFKNSRINVVYYNDLHGATKNLNSFEQNQDKFYKENSKGTNYTLCGGDAFLDVNDKNDIVAKTLAPRTDAFAAGNHDLEGGTYFSKLINKFKMANKWVAANVFYSKHNSLEHDIQKSIIIKKGNQKIGVIGVAPLDFEKDLFKNKHNDFIRVHQFNETVKDVKKEVSHLQKQGINKIFLLAHTGDIGYDSTQYYKNLAKINGIDVIIGGHDHKEVDRWDKTQKGEPVKIVSTGRSDKHEFNENLDYLGLLNLEFDDNGVLVKDKCKNKFENIDSVPEIAPEDTATVAVIDEPLKPSNPLKEHSEIGNIVADSNLWYVNKHTKGEKADFAFVNSGTIRGNFDNNIVTMNDIKNAVPYTTQNLIKTSLTKKQIINTLNICAQSTTLPKIKPGMMQVSNMEYTVNPDLTVKDVHIMNNDGTIKYNLDKFKNDDKFNAVYDTFLATGPLGLTDLSKDVDNDTKIEKFNVSRQEALCDYLTKNSKLYNYKNVRIKSQSCVPV